MTAEEGEYGHEDGDMHESLSQNLEPIIHLHFTVSPEKSSYNNFGATYPLLGNNSLQQ